MASVTVGYIRRGVEREIEFFIGGLRIRAGRKALGVIECCCIVCLFITYILPLVSTLILGDVYIYIYFNIVL